MQYILAPFFALLSLITSNFSFTSLPPETLSPSPEPPQQLVMTPGGQSISVKDDLLYTIHAVEIPENARLELIPNFEDKDSGAHLVEAHSCDAAINGGFYQTDHLPLGLFISRGKRYGHPLQSNLVTGYFFEDIAGLRTFSPKPPEDFRGMKYILQTGPLLSTLSEPKLAHDEHARRSLLLADRDNRLFMAVVTEKDNTSSGPLLAYLPRIFRSREVQQKIAVTTLLNLDGGAASFFFSKEGSQTLAFSEITSIGSLFCLKR